MNSFCKSSIICASMDALSEIGYECTSVNQKMTTENEKPIYGYNMVVGQQKYFDFRCHESGLGVSPRHDHQYHHFYQSFYSLSQYKCLISILHIDPTLVMRLSLVCSDCDL
ncbi:unnamed protein product [Amoebophrya sp. A25]|nr:unnamed protein product [Amoebophrya sp. A25]|eukprot:GSA25T00000420001.1